MKAETRDTEPTFVLRASDKWAAPLVRIWAGLTALTQPAKSALAHDLAARMDAWRERQQ